MNGAHFRGTLGSTGATGGPSTIGKASVSFKQRAGSAQKPANQRNTSKARKVGAKETSQPTVQVNEKGELVVQEEVEGRQEEEKAR